MTINQSAIQSLLRQAGQKLLQAKLSPRAIHQKQGAANFVTDFDVETQEFLIDGLRRIMPDAFFYGEENTAGSDQKNASGENVFYIDPIDGTTNFMFRYHHSCISVGLAHRGEMAAGFVYNPYVDEMYTAVKGEGSYLNGERLRIANVGLSQGIVAFGCARYNEGDADRLFALVKDLYLNSLAVRNGGSATLDLCRVASGSNVAYIEFKLQPYDYVAASLIIEEAGGRIMQADGSRITLDRPCSIIAGTPKAVLQMNPMINLDR